MFSNRFEREVYITKHARQRMSERGIDFEMLAELLETGTVRYKDSFKAWIGKDFDGREDNMICVAVAIEHVVVVKTVMHFFKWEG